MALSATVAWEVRGATGSDNNGGGFNTAAAGTDYSTSSSNPHVVIDGVTITATVQATTTSVKLAGYTVASTDVGNIVNFNGGTLTQGRYQINTVTTGATNTWNLDRSAGTNGQTGTGNMGGSLATIQTAITATTVGNMVTYVKADGTYALTAALAISGPTGTPSYQTRLIGYTSSRTDAGQATVTVGAGAGVNGITFSSNAVGWSIENFIIDGTATSGSQGLVGVQIGGSGGFKLINCKVMNFANEGVKGGAGAQTFSLINCEVTGCAGTTATVDAVSNNSLIGIYDSYIHDNTIAGVQVLGSGTCSIIHSIIANNTGASNDGVLCGNNVQLNVFGSLFYGNGRDGIRLGSGSPSGIARSVIKNNIFAKNGAFGLNQNTAVTAPATTQPGIDYNGYWSNSSGAIQNITAGAHDVQITGTDPTNDPFVAKASHNWALNNTAGAGTLLRAVGFPGAMPGLTTPVGALDIGPYQHQFPSSIVIINE